jgi:MFS family permease
MAGKRSLGWQIGLSAYWFAVSMKWFILLTAVLPGQIEAIYGSEAKAQAWGGVVMIGAIWAMIGPGLFGHFSDRIGKWRPFLAIGASVTVIAFFALFQASTIFHLIFGYLLLQIGDDLAQGPYSSLIPGLVEPDQRGRVSGVMGLLMMAAQIAGGIGAMLLQSSVAAIYLFLAGSTVVCALITLLVVRENPPHEVRPKSTFVQAWIEPWKAPDFRWVWFTRFANAVGFYLIYNYLRYFLADSVDSFNLFGFEVASKGEGTEEEVKDAAFRAVFLLAMVISVFGSIGAVAGGRLADKVGRKKTVYVSGALMALPVIPFIFVRDFTAIALLATVFAIGYGAYQASDWALAADVMPNQKSLAKDMGIWQSCVTAPQIISGGFGVIVTEGNRSSMGLGYSLAFGLAAVAFMVAVVFVSRIRGST